MTPSSPPSSPRSSSPTERSSPDARRRSGRGATVSKRLLGSVAVRRAVGGLGAAYLWLIFRSTRWEWVGREHLNAMFAAPAFIGAVWHSRLAPIAKLRPRGRRAVALISENRDGDLIARVIQNTGAESVRGSSRNADKPELDKGGREAAAGLVDALGAGAIVVVTPDGPRGPRMRAKAGVAVVAAAAQVPVLPVAYATRRGKEFRSWDRFRLPVPFDRGVWVFGAPIPPADPNDPDAIEARRREIEEAVIAATREADRRMDRTTPEPDPDPAASAPERRA